MLKVLELFAGIGACSKALSNLGIKHEIVDAVEIDKFAIKSFNAIHGTDFKPQDITKWDKKYYCEACQRLVGKDDECPQYKTLLSPARLNVDLIMHGSPCQDFSVAGKGAGGDEGSGTRSSLLYETLRIVEELRPKYVIWENVPNILSEKHHHNFANYLRRMRELGYVSQYTKLNAKDFDVPQNRLRVFTVSVYLPDKASGWDDLNWLDVFHFPEPIPLTRTLKDVLEPEVDEKYYLSDEKVANMKISHFELDKLSNVKNENEEARSIRASNFKNPQCVKVGDLNIKGHDAIRRVYSPKGLSPTLTTMEGGNREPKIVAMRGRNPENPSDRIPTEQRLEVNSKGVSNALTTVQKDNLVLGPVCLNPKGGRNGQEGLQPSLKDRIYDSDGVACCCATSTFFMPNYTDKLRVRKLTPKECWRLMGFSDEDFDKASKINSNSQLYKQAGNSIVVNVLEAVLYNLLIKKE